MSDRDDDDIEFVTPEGKVQQGCANVIAVGCAGCLVALVWLVGTGTSVYYAFVSKHNSWTQNVMSDVAATFLLFAISPLLFAFWKAGSVAGLALSSLIAVAMLVGSWFLNGAWQHLAIGLGCGVLLLEFLDLGIKQGWITMTSDMERRAKEMGEAKPNIVLGQ
jgi:hypothetical protein